MIKLILSLLYSSVLVVSLTSLSGGEDATYTALDESPSTGSLLTSLPIVPSSTVVDASATPSAISTTANASPTADPAVSDEMQAILARRLAFMVADAPSGADISQWFF